MAVPTVMALMVFAVMICVVVFQINNGGAPPRSNDDETNDAEITALLYSASSSNGPSSSVSNPARRGEPLRSGFESLPEKVENMHFDPHVVVPGQLLAEGISRDKANADIHQLRQQRRSESAIGAADAKTDLHAPKTSSGEPSGFFVLSMHRSGTSMLAGLLVTGLDYKTGEPLIGSAFDNEKGFFELLDVVLQNDELMKAQEASWSSNVIAYKGERGVDDKKSDKVNFHKGDKALEFLNNPDNRPWLQKDPRMCITLKTWIPLFTNEPAAIFTYRHPLEVALSLKKKT
jgi:hypothetical protein